MPSLSLYDVRGIQEYIFSSPKLKENIGASFLVAKALEEFLKEVLKSLGNVKMDWQANLDFEMSKNNGLAAEIIYIGGGNAMVVYKDKDTAINATRALARTILEKTGGALRFSVAHIETDFSDFSKDRKDLINLLRENKQKTIETFPLLGIAITKQGITDGLPAAEKAEEGFVSLPAYKKREEARQEHFDYLLEGYSHYKFPLEFDQLGERMEEAHIAVVHIDGNNMGRMVEDVIKGVKDYNEAVKKIRELSRKITQDYQDAARRLIKKLIKNIKDERLKDEIGLVWDNEDKKLFLPFRPLVLNGDDVTFVTNGRLGISVAEEFLKEISKKAINNENLSACAGVAIVKRHFPFYRAYQLAESLCSSAKLKGKTLAALRGGQIKENWLDFHIVYAGIRTDLNELRKRQYNVPGITQPDPLKKEKHGVTIIKHEQFNLLWRPWCVAGGCEEKYKWEGFKQVLNEKKQKWPRSKLKDLRDEFFKGKEAAEFFVRFCEKKGNKLPLFNGNNQIFRDNQTPYFDALELLDFYIELEECS